MIKTHDFLIWLRRTQDGDWLCIIRTEKIYFHKFRKGFLKEEAVAAALPIFPYFGETCIGKSHITPYVWYISIGFPYMAFHHNSIDWISFLLFSTDESIHLVFCFNFCCTYIKRICRYPPLLKKNVYICKEKNPQHTNKAFLGFRKSLNWILKTHFFASSVRTEKNWKQIVIFLFWFFILYQSFVNPFLSLLLLQNTLNNICFQAYIPTKKMPPYLLLNHAARKWPISLIWKWR